MSQNGYVWHVHYNSNCLIHRHIPLTGMGNTGADPFFGVTGQDLWTQTRYSGWTKLDWARPDQFLDNGSTWMGLGTYQSGPGKKNGRTKTGLVQSSPAISYNIAIDGYPAIQHSAIAKNINIDIDGQPFWSGRVQSGPIWPKVALA